MGNSKTFPNVTSTTLNLTLGWFCHDIGEILGNIYHILWGIRSPCHVPDFIMAGLFTQYLFYLFSTYVILCYLTHIFFRKTLPQWNISCTLSTTILFTFISPISCLQTIKAYPPKYKLNHLDQQNLYHFSSVSSNITSLIHFLN